MEFGRLSLKSILILVLIVLLTPVILGFIVSYFEKYTFPIIGLFFGIIYLFNGADEYKHRKKIYAGKKSNLSWFLNEGYGLLLLITLPFRLLFRRFWVAKKSEKEIEMAENTVIAKFLIFLTLFIGTVLTLVSGVWGLMLILGY